MQVRPLTQCLMRFREMDSGNSFRCETVVYMNDSAVIDMQREMQDGRNTQEMSQLGGT